MLKNSIYLQGSHLWIIVFCNRKWLQFSSLLPKDLSSSPSSFLFPHADSICIFGKKLFSAYSTHGQSGCISCMHLSPSSSSYGLPALYILIPQFPLWFPLPPYSFGLFLFLISLPFVHLFSAPCPGGGFLLQGCFRSEWSPAHSESILYFFISVALHPVATILPLLKTALFFLALVQPAS